MAILQGFAKHLRERRRCHGREGGARDSGAAALPPLHYILGQGRGGRRSLAPSSKEGVRLRRGEESILPKAPTRCLFPLGLSLSLISWRMGLLGGHTSPPGAGPLPHLAHAALQGRWPHLVDPRDPPDGPGTLPIKPETFPVTKTGLPIYKSLPPDHSGTPRDVRDLIRDSEQLSGYRILISL